jgi:NAD(P) transhydrogenase
VDHEHVLDSDSILSIAYLPRSLLVLGGGVIASEYAAMFAALGCKVTQADQLDQPLAFLDPELSVFYVDELHRNGGEYIPRAMATSTRWDGVSQVRTEFKDGRSIMADKVLVALGRLANVDGLNLEAAGIALSSRGHVQVNECLETTAPGVYAAGDVIGPPALASVSMEQGRRAACHALGLLVPSDPVSRLPSGVYTIPEIATVGLDEHGARRHFGGAIVGRARFEEIARGQINGCQRGLLKLVADPGGRRVVGVQIAGDGATELVHIGQLGLAAELDVDAYVDNVFNFPTMAEAYRIAALDIVKQRGRVSNSETVADVLSAIL